MSEKSSSQVCAAQKLIKGQPNEFWNEFGIYPQALEETDSPDQARKHLSMLPVGNLKLLCEQGEIPLVDDAGEGSFLDSLMNASNVPTIIHLRELMKRRTEAIEGVFESTFSASTRSGFAATVSELGRSSNETIKPFTKLLLLYRHSPETLRNIFYQNLWYSKTSHYEYEIEGNWSLPIDEMAQSVAAKFSETTRLRVRFSGSHEIENGIQVLLFLREYAPRIKRDFTSGYNVLHECGLIVVGIDIPQKRLHLKSGNRQFAEVLKIFVESQAGCKIRLLKNEVFSDYDPEFVRCAFQGAYRTDKHIDIKEIEYARSALPGHGPITVKTGFLENSVRKALEFLSDGDAALLDIRGPADISRMTVGFAGRTAEIVTQVQKDGAVRLQFDNAGWLGDIQAEFEDAFLDSFGVPLNRLVDPTVISMGNVGVLAYLLNLHCEEDVQGYQQDSFDYLCEEGYLTRTIRPIRGCRSNFCKMRYKAITIPEQEVCRECDQPLEEWDVVEISRNDSKIFGLVGEVFQEATGWELSAKEQQFESRKYRSLTNQTTGGPDDTICVVMQDHITNEMRMAFERLSRPLVVIQPHTDSRNIFVDSDNVGRISLAYLVAAQVDEHEQAKCHQKCSEMIKRLLASYKERTERAARHSYSILSDKQGEISGNQYETEIFNILRPIFPYCHKLGRPGKPEPDGFICIPDYRDIEDLVDASSWNFSYDAKYSNKTGGYDLDHDEQRKMLEYILKFRNSRQVLDGRDRKIRAHVIISNNIAEEKIKNAADFLYSKDGLPSKHRDVCLVLMRDQFLLKLFDWMQSHVEEVCTKRPYLLELLIELMSKESEERYLVLDKDDADSLVAKLSNYQVIEKRVSGKALQDSLDVK